MASYRWKGRSADGHELSGSLDAGSKEEVLERLRGQGITVTSVSGGAGDEPSNASFGAGERRIQAAPPAAMARPSLSERLARERAADPPNRVRRLLMAAGCVLAALAVGYFGPIVTYRCERTGNETVDCTLIERDLGVMTIREQRLSGVTSVETEYTGSTTTTRGSSKSSGNASRVVIRDGAGHTIRPAGSDGLGTIGASTSRIYDDIRGFLTGSPERQMTVWQGYSVPLAFQAGLLFLALLMVAATMLSMSRAATDRVYSAAGRLAEAADAKAARDSRTE